MAIIKRPQITNAGKDVEKREHSYTVGGSVKLMQPLRQTAQKLLKKLKTELPYDPAIPLLSIYLKKMKKYFKKIYTVEIRHYKGVFFCINLHRYLIFISLERISFSNMFK